jgi:hypothetical protein
MVAHAKAQAASANLAANTPPSKDPIPSTESIRDFLADQAEIALKSGKDALAGASTALDTAFGRDPGNCTSGCQLLSYEEARLWLQSYNAGPYALLKYKGNVPYRETQNYVPRVLKYYQQDLSDTPYEPYIQSASQKYGLDPQMIRAIMKTESDFRRTEVSSAGARGLMQVMPCVWSEIRKRYKLEWNYAGSVFEPEKNIEVACAYLAWLRYDFLPQHFAEFDPNPEAPATLVRDKARQPANRIDTAAVAKPKTPLASAKGSVRTLKNGKTIVTMRGKGRTTTVKAAKAVAIVDSAQDASSFGG